MSARAPGDAEERLDALWDALARGVDRAGPAHERLFLAKLSLLLARALDDPDEVAALIELALRDLD